MQFNCLCFDLKKQVENINFVESETECKNVGIIKRTYEKFHLKINLTGK